MNYFVASIIKKVSHDGVAAMAMGPINLDSHLCGPISRPLFAPLLPGKEKCGLSILGGM